MAKTNMPLKRFCGDAVGDALRAIGRQRGDYDPVPDDFTERERFDMFRYLMHEHVYPCSDLLGYEGRITYSWTHSVWSWRHGGKREFIERVKEAAQEELAAEDYEVYDLRQIHCLIGDHGPRFRRMLVAEDAAMMEQRMNGMEADLAAMDKKLKWFYGGMGHAALPELRYRIALYNNVYEAVIRGGKGGKLWTMLMP